jgi:N-acetylmuramoyl-L-alanine amidase
MEFVITAGHSNTDPGAVAHGHTEAEIAVDMRNLVATELRQRGHRVWTDGEGRDNQPLATAINLIHHGAVALEIHLNASSNPQATGVETIALPKHRDLAQRISFAVSAVLGLRVRGEAGYIDQSASARGKLGFVTAGGLIAELCFISNQTDLVQLQSNMHRVASAIAEVLAS